MMAIIMNSEKWDGMKKINFPPFYPLEKRFFIGIFSGVMAKLLKI
jgi:hypothetical protein